MLGFSQGFDVLLRANGGLSVGFIIGSLNTKKPHLAAWLFCCWIFLAINPRYRASGDSV